MNNNFYDYEIKCNVFDKFMLARNNFYCFRLHFNKCSISKHFNICKNGFPLFEQTFMKTIKAMFADPNSIFCDASTLKLSNLEQCIKVCNKRISLHVSSRVKTNSIYVITLYSFHLSMSLR